MEGWEEPAGEASLAVSLLSSFTIWLVCSCIVSIFFSLPRGQPASRVFGLQYVLLAGDVYSLSLDR